MNYTRLLIIPVIFAAAPALTTPTLAQSYTTAAEVKPILGATKPGWIAVREYDGQDLLYFTNLLAWRCGLSGITYAINAEPPQVWEMEPCHDDTAQPNAITDAGPLIYTTRPLGSIATITVIATYGDGTTETGDYTRTSVLMP